jgi:hypothetical protein
MTALQPDFHRHFWMRLKRFLVRFCVVFTICILILETVPLGRFYARWLAGPWNDPDGDILIVLSSEEQPDGFVGPVSYWRAVYAVCGCFRSDADSDYPVGSRAASRRASRRMPASIPRKTMP